MREAGSYIPKRKIRLKTRKTTRKDLEKVCDQLLREVVKARDGGKCRFCGRPGNQGHHIFSRRYHNVKYEPNNLILLCYPHHMLFAHSKHEEFRDWVIREIGADRFELLQRLAYMTGNKLDLSAIRLMLRKERAAYEAAR